MTLNFRYLVSATWTDIPEYAHPDDRGSALIVYAKPTDTTGAGAPCAGIGLPTLEIRASLLRGDGWAWWQAFFGDATAESVALPGVTGWDQRTGAWSKYSGTLWRPTAGSVQPGATPGTTIYRDVLIQVRDLLYIPEPT